MAERTVRLTGDVTSAPNASDPNAGAPDNGERLRAKLQEAIGDSYKILELLGRGGMGIVFRAKEVSLDREVALKVLAIDPIFAPEAYERFEREAKLAAKLDHPNIVPIFAVGHRDSIAYYTMRFVRGGTLEDMLARRKVLDYDRTVAILRDVAAALDFAHAQGVVHRDVKPANILLGDNGHASVADFGIAKALGSTSNNTTGAGIVGSPSYMSPEQWRGQPVDGRADQYALGIVAFEMLTGLRPFDTERVEDLLALHLNAEAPNITAIKPEMPASVDAAIRRAISKQASDRFPTASAFVETLAGTRPVTSASRALTGRGQRFQPRPRKRGRAALVVALALTAGVGAAFAAPPTRPAMLQWLDGALQGAGTLRGRADSLFSGDTTSPASGRSDSLLVGAASDSAALTAAGDSLARSDSVIPDSNAAAPLVLQRTPLETTSETLATPGGPAPFRRRTIEYGYIAVTVNGGAAPVIVDGESKGFSPQLVRVEVGDHVVSVRGAGDMFMPFQHSVHVSSSDTARAVFEVQGRRRRPVEPADSAPRPDSAAPDSTPPPPR